MFNVFFATTSVVK